MTDKISSDSIGTFFDFVRTLSSQEGYDFIGLEQLEDAMRSGKPLNASQLRNLKHIAKFGRMRADDDVSRGLFHSFFEAYQYLNKLAQKRPDVTSQKISDVTSVHLRRMPIFKHHVKENFVIDISKLEGANVHPETVYARSTYEGDTWTFHFKAGEPNEIKYLGRQILLDHWHAELFTRTILEELGFVRGTDIFYEKIVFTNKGSLSLPPGKPVRGIHHIVSQESGWIPLVLSQTDQDGRETGLMINPVLQDDIVDIAYENLETMANIFKQLGIAAHPGSEILVNEKSGEVTLGKVVNPKTGEVSLDATGKYSIFNAEQFSDAVERFLAFGKALFLEETARPYFPDLRLLTTSDHHRAAFERRLFETLNLFSVITNYKPSQDDEFIHEVIHEFQLYLENQHLENLVEHNEEQIGAIIRNYYEGIGTEGILPFLTSILPRIVEKERPEEWKEVAGGYIAQAKTSGEDINGYWRKVEDELGIVRAKILDFRDALSKKGGGNSGAPPSSSSAGNGSMTPINGPTGNSGSHAQESVANFENISDATYKTSPTRNVIYANETTPRSHFFLQHTNTTNNLLSGAFNTFTIKATPSLRPLRN